MQVSIAESAAPVEYRKLTQIIYPFYVKYILRSVKIESFFYTSGTYPGHYSFIVYQKAIIVFVLTPYTIVLH